MWKLLRTPLIELSFGIDMGLVLGPYICIHAQYPNPQMLKSGYGLSPRGSSTGSLVPSVTAFTRGGGESCLVMGALPMENINADLKE